MLGDDDILEAIESGNYTIFFEAYEDMYGLEKTVLAVNLFLVYMLQLYHDLLSEEAKACVQSMVNYLKGDLTSQEIEDRYRFFDQAHPLRSFLDSEYGDVDLLNRAVMGMMQTAPYHGYEERERASFSVEDLLEVRNFEDRIQALLQYIYSLKGEIRFGSVTGFTLENI